MCIQLQVSNNKTTSVPQVSHKCVTIRPRGKMGAKRLHASKRSPLFKRRPREAIPSKGCGVCGQFGMHTWPNAKSSWNAPQGYWAYFIYVNPSGTQFRALTFNKFKIVELSQWSCDRVLFVQVNTNGLQVTFLTTIFDTFESLYNIAKRSINWNCKLTLRFWFCASFMCKDTSKLTFWASCGYWTATTKVVFVAIPSESMASRL